MPPHNNRSHWTAVAINSIGDACFFSSRIKLTLCLVIFAPPTKIKRKGWFESAKLIPIPKTAVTTVKRRLVAMKGPLAPTQQPDRTQSILCVSTNFVVSPHQYRSTPISYVRLNTHTMNQDTNVLQHLKIKTSLETIQ